MVLIAGGVWYYLQSRHAALPSAPVAVQPAPAEPAAEPAIQHPLPPAQDDSASKAPLPALTDSDPALIDALAKVIGASAVKDYLVPENIVRHLVRDHRQSAAPKGGGGEAADRTGRGNVPR